MSPSTRRWTSRLWWIVPVLALGVSLGFELDWGRQVHYLPEPQAALEARPVTPTLLPEYKIEGGLPGHSETVSRTLFNPTRRPAPIAVAEAARSQIKTGQFILTGTSLAGERNIAFLKEVAGGKSRSVSQGEQINGMLVAEVKADRVRFTLGGDSEELVLKMAAGPKATVNPTPPAAAPQGATGAPPGQRPGAAAVQAEAMQLMEQRRRAAQAATEAEVVPTTPPAPARSALIPGMPPAAAGQGTPASGDPTWNDVFERMRSRGQPTK
jgi:hypothetical protein